MNNVIFRRLRSSAGASLLLALAFFLLCSFVGSTVLAAAAGNAGRMNGQREQRQGYFSQRSAIELLQAKLQNDIKLVIEKETTTITEKTVNEYGGVTVVVKDPTYKVVFTANPTYTESDALNTLVLQAAVTQYIESGDAGADPSKSFVGFPAGTIVTYPNDGQCTVKLEKDGSEVETLQLDYLFADVPTADERTSDKYDFIFQPGGDDAQMHLYLPSSITRSTTTTAIDVVVEGNKSTETKTEKQTITISWQNPVVRKGGAE